MGIMGNMRAMGIRRTVIFFTLLIRYSLSPVTYSQSQGIWRNRHPTRLSAAAHTASG